MDEIMKTLNIKIKKTFTGYFKLQQTFISEGIYVDDLVIFVNKEEALQYNRNLWNEALKTFNIKINIDKANTMIIPK